MIIISPVPNPGPYCGLYQVQEFTEWEYCGGQGQHAPKPLVYLGPKCVPPQLFQGLCKCYLSTWDLLGTAQNSEGLKQSPSPSMRAPRVSETITSSAADEKGLGIKVLGVWV